MIVIAMRVISLIIVLLFSGCGGGGGGGDTTTNPGVPLNTAPVANAGPDNSFLAGAAVSLDCSGSSDPQGDALSFLWQQTDGPLVQLSDNSACTPTFTAPDATATLVFLLEVRDAQETSTDDVAFAITGSEPIPSISFSDTGPDMGIEPYSMAIGPHAGIAVEDYNDDGLIDLFVPNGEGFADQLYVNRGNGVFEEIAASVGLALLQNHRSALWLDYDGDHDLDLIIGGDCRQDPVSSASCVDPENLWLYRQSPDGTFEDVTLAAGLDSIWGGTANWHRGGISAGDIDNDGYLELLVIGWQDRAHLFKNNADGTFTEITVAANLSDAVFAYQQAVFHDFNRDGWMDMYIAVDGLVPNRLYINQQDGTFIDMASNAGVDYAATDMGIALGDINNDGHVDMYITEITQFVEGEYHHNQLYLNDGIPSVPSYTDISETVGAQNGFWGWGATFIDYDNDGWQDLATTNGKNRTNWMADKSRLWRNTGIAGRAFDDVSIPAQFDDDYIAAGLVAADLDRDGDMDLVQTTSEGGPLRVLSNNAGGSSNNYISIRPRMAGANHWSIGAVVTIEMQGGRSARVITAGTSTDSQEPAEAHFGLGEATAFDRLTIDWPGGTQTIHTGLPINGSHLITANQP